MKENWKDRFSRIVAVGLVIAIFVGGLLVVWPTYRRSTSLRRRQAQLRAEIEAKRAEIARLRENQRRFKTDPEFIERIARQNHRVYPGEIVFVFDRDK